MFLNQLFLFNLNFIRHPFVYRGEGWWWSATTHCCLTLNIFKIQQPVNYNLRLKRELFKLVEKNLMVYRTKCLRKIESKTPTVLASLSSHFSHMCWLLFDRVRVVLQPSFIICKLIRANNWPDNRFNLSLIDNLLKYPNNHVSQWNRARLVNVYQGRFLREGMDISKLQT